MTDLKPCPFCGKNVAVMTNAHDLEECSNFEDDNCPCSEFESTPCNYNKVVCDFNKGGCGASSGYYPTIEEAIEAWNRRVKSVKDHPAADVVEVVHGKWDIVDCGSGWVDGKCSVCGYTDCFDESGFYIYCPDCGAKMDGKVGDEK